MLKRTTGLLCALFATLTVLAQQKPAAGIITGNVMDDKKKALEGASVQLIPMGDSLRGSATVTDQAGQFTIGNVPFGYYRLSISYVGLRELAIDSIYFRAERFDFNLTDITMQPTTTDSLNAVVIYAEKPLIQTQDGNITFNAGESALAAGSNASELLTSVPLVAKDPDGKILVRGKEPRILIDDKPVELNLQQLQDLLESMPGSSIDKIEVLTNPPPQYANETGGVINIVTKKGRVGKSGRVSVTSGTRGDVNLNGSFTYRRQGLAININGGAGYSRYLGHGYSIRNNIYTDSSNFFNTTNNYINRNIRPNFRANVDYDINKTNLLNLTVNFNQNNYNNNNLTEYQNINRFDQLWKVSRRNIHSEGQTTSPNASLSYTWKGKPGESLRILTSYSFSNSHSDRDYFQYYLNPDFSATGKDSTQQQLNTTRVNAHAVRADYSRTLPGKKTFVSVGGAYTRSNNYVLVDASYLKKPDSIMLPLDVLSNEFRFHQTVANYHMSLKQILGENFSFTAGSAVEHTAIWFELMKEGRDVKNNYWTWMPFANINKSWRDKLSITLAYRRTIRRPGIGELNPSIDFSDPYNIRFGNENLEASTAHNFDFVVGRTRSKYYLNFGLGYNIVQDVFSQVRTLLPDGKTQITWENISGRREYEMSSWNGVSLSRKIRINLSASYTYNRYSAFDKAVRNFRNGGSFTSNINSSFIPGDLWNMTAGFNLNRFANPQGYARWNTSMNLGVMRKFFRKRMVVTFNTIDPFTNQQRKTFTYGTNFNLESYSFTRTRNFRLSVAYSLTKMAKKKKPAIPRLPAVKSK